MEIRQLHALKAFLNGGSLPTPSFAHRLPYRTDSVESEFESYITTDGQSVSLSCRQTPIWDPRLDLYYCQTVEGLLMWGTLSDERTGLSFTIAASPRQRRHSRVRVPWDSRPYFTVSDSRLPFSSPPTRRARLEWSCASVFPVVFLITTLLGPSRKHRFQQYLYCRMRDMFTEPLHRKKNMFQSRSLATTVSLPPQFLL
jgi:hypothetical protein